MLSQGNLRRLILCFDSPMKEKDCYPIYSGGIIRGGCVVAGVKLGSGSNQRQLRQSVPMRRQVLPLR